MSSYRLVKQDVTEARRLLCRTLTEISSSEEADFVVVIEKRGDPLAAIISLSEAAQYFAWKAAEIRRRARERGEESIEEMPEQTVPEVRDAAEHEGLRLPEGWRPPDDYARHCRAEGCSEEIVVEGLLQHYASHGLTPEDARRIAEGIFGEGGAEP